MQCTPSLALRLTSMSLHVRSFGEMNVNFRKFLHEYSIGQRSRADFYSSADGQVQVLMMANTN